MSGVLAKGVPPNLPRFLLFIKLAIIGLSVIVLALSAFAISVFYYGGAAGLLIFAVIKTWIIYGALTFIELKAPHMYFRIVAIVAYFVSIVIWLASWAWAASLSAACFAAANAFDVTDNELALDGYTYTYDSLYGWDASSWRKEGGALAGCAALGAIIWILAIVNWVLLLRACFADKGTTQQAELGQMGHAKAEATAAVYPASQPAPQYGQQPGVYQQAPYQQPQQPYPTQ